MNNPFEDTRRDAAIRSRGAPPAFVHARGADRVSALRVWRGTPDSPGLGAGVTRLAALLFAITLGAGLTGCGFLRPAKPTARHFVLTPLPAAGPSVAASNSLAVGLGQVKLPAYLFDTSLAVRTGTNEIKYLTSALWAERLDTGFQRVLAANLAILLSTDRVHLSAWRGDDVAAEVYVTIEQFDVNASGKGILVARWRILSPGGESILQAGTSRLARQGPPPNTGVSGAVATLSDLLADFSRQLAQAIEETASRQAAPVPR